MQARCFDFCMASNLRDLAFTRTLFVGGSTGNQLTLPPSIAFVPSTAKTPPPGRRQHASSA
jgi:hypothetical protein